VPVHGRQVTWPSAGTFEVRRQANARWQVGAHQASFFWYLQDSCCADAQTDKLRFIEGAHRCARIVYFLRTHLSY